MAESSISLQRVANAVGTYNEAEDQMPKPLATKVIGTVECHSHGLGSNIVSAVFSASGFKVYNLGHGVPADVFIKKAEGVCGHDRIHSADCFNNGSGFQGLCHALPGQSRKKHHAPTVLHICGGSMRMMESMKSDSMASASTKMWAMRMKSAIRGRCHLIGNLNNVSVLQMNTAQGVEKECARVLSEGVSALEPGCGISPYSPTANITAKVKARDKYF